jgi:DNA invertase Pin-like site-specific DNA recombinase
LIKVVSGDLNLFSIFALKVSRLKLEYADKFQLHIYAALAEQERDFISKRTKAALQEAKARGQKLGGLRDATMKRNETVRSNAEARARKLHGLIYPLRSTGKSLREIASELDNAGVKTPRGGSWSASQVKRILDRLSESRSEQAS